MMSKQMGLDASAALSLTVGLAKEGSGCLSAALASLGGSGGAGGPTGSYNPAAASADVGTTSDGSTVTRL